jgi:hypothetical protein
MGLSILKILIHVDFLDHCIFVPVFPVVDHLDDVVRRVFGGTTLYSGFLFCFFNVFDFACRSCGGSCTGWLACGKISAEMSLFAAIEAFAGFHQCIPFFRGNLTCTYLPWHGVHRVGVVLFVITREGIAPLVLSAQGVAGLLLLSWFVSTVLRFTSLNQQVDLLVSSGCVDPLGPGARVVIPDDLFKESGGESIAKDIDDGIIVEDIVCVAS